MNKVKRLVVAVAGLIVLLIGIVMIPYPGPGLLVVFAGLGILATEFEWARRLLHAAKDKYGQFKNWMAQQNFFIRALVWLFTAAVVLVTVWLMNGYGFVNYFLDLGWDWAISPLPIFH